MSDRSIDVLVVGAGAAGIAAARAAQESGASRVVLASHGAGATELTSGWILGRKEEAPSWLSSVGFLAPGAYRFASLAGTVHEACSAMPSLLELSSLPTEGVLGVVELLAGASWDARFVADSLQRILHRSVRVVAVGSAAPRGASTGELARSLDAPGLVDALCPALRTASEGCVGLLFPPALGLVSDEVYVQFRDRLKLPCGECGGAAGDPTALRFAKRLARAVPSSVERVRGLAEFVGEDAAGRVRIRVGKTTYSAGALVLATGGLLGGGLRFEEELREPLTGAPVWWGGREGSPPVRSAEWGQDPARLFEPDLHGQTIADRAGVRVDERGQVLAEDSSLWKRWLFAAGSVVHRPRGERTLTAALASGALAGKSAWTAAQQT